MNACFPRHIGGPGAESSPGSVGSRAVPPPAPLRAVPCTSRRRRRRPVPFRPVPFRSDSGRAPPPFSAQPPPAAGPRPRDVNVSLRGHPEIPEWTSPPCREPVPRGATAAGRPHRGGPSAPPPRGDSPVGLRCVRANPPLTAAAIAQAAAPGPAVPGSPPPAGRERGGAGSRGGGGGRDTQRRSQRLEGSPQSRRGDSRARWRGWRSPSAPGSGCGAAPVNAAEGPRRALRSRRLSSRV